MLVVRLIHLKDMPSFENTLESFNKNNLNLSDENSELKLLEKMKIKKVIYVE